MPKTLTGPRAPLWAGLMISVVGTQMQQWALFWHISQLSKDPIAVSIVGGVRFLAVLAFSLVGGLVAGAMNGSALAAVQGHAAWEPGTLEFILIWFRIGAPIGLGLGITTGAALFWFSRNPKSRTIVDTASQSAQ